MLARPSGVTQHAGTCKFNPANQHRPATPPPVPPPTFHTPPPHPFPQSTPSPQRGPVEVPPTPSQNSPRRNVWTTRGRPGILVRDHPILSGTYFQQSCGFNLPIISTGDPVDIEGYPLPAGTPPTPEEPDDNPLWPFANPEHMMLADFLYSKVQMSQGDVSFLMRLWDALQRRFLTEQFGDDFNLDSDESSAPFTGHLNLLSTIDSIPHGDIPWQGFTVQYDGELPENPPAWMTAKYEVWFRDPLEVMEAQLRNPEFANHIDYAAKEVKGAEDGKRQYVDLMSGDWAWERSTQLGKDKELHGAMFVPVVLGSDKTTVSVATGQTEYYPIYASAGNVPNHLRRAHKGAVTLIGFLAIPKTGKDEEDSLEFRRFRRQLYHSSIARILMLLKPWMTKARVTKCGDGHWRRVVYEIGPYIADYPEQCLLACVVQGWCARCIAEAKNLDGSPDTVIGRSHIHTEKVRKACGGNLKEMWDAYGIIGDVIPFTTYFPRANIHELMSPDILHQLVKGTFKDHLVTWVVEYLEGQENGKALVAEMDWRIAAAPHFPRLRRFNEGRGFKQWTGNDSKALMNVFLPAITGLVPPSMVRAVAAFLDFCYLVRRSQIDEDVLTKLDSAVERYHAEREIFIEEGIRDNFNLPRQHSLVHYRPLIQMFGAPNGLCSSITESKHIAAVKDVS
ncbi:hypothetical protein FA13DRAFT_1636945 [Coprinellus micaceus]|uniref:Uncharacterized protein n=1 Tax=Coprinellus micaceus TaxID=71717 RepID=A0A4Y7SW34_COPMI|nr:hypothetical protein FA13DRAFT_1636945 [Coprinellus micaceus]